MTNNQHPSEENQQNSADSESTDNKKEPLQTENSDFQQKLSGFHQNTLIALGLAALFIVLCFINTTVIRWWLMVPLALGAGYLMFNRFQQSDGDEKKVCLYGLWVISIAFVLRDIYLAHGIATFADGMNNMAHQLQNMFHKK